MKKIYLSCLLTCLAFVTKAQYTDVINNNISFEFTIEYNHYFNASSESGNSEPVIRTDIWTSNYGWLGEACHNWSCEPPCYDGGGSDIWWAGQCGFDATMQVYMLSYESDNSDECTWYNDDDDAWQGSGVLRDGQTQQRIVYQSSDFRPCQIINSMGNGGTGWLFPDNPYFNQILQLKWRYVAGDESTNPLDLGTIGGNVTRSDINSNRSVNNVGNWVDLQYSNTNGEASADVWYKFNIASDRVVSIDTDNGATDFDTKIWLYTLSGTFIGSDDDGGSGTTSAMEVELCAGTYLVAVEGYSTNTGVFELAVRGGAEVSALNANASSTGTSCSGVGDGYAEWNPTGGVSPYNWTWQGTNIPGNYFSGLAEGNFALVVTDACGNSDSETISIDVEDNTDPTAQCQNSFEISVAQGQPVQLSASDIDNGSSDNCGISGISISQTSFTVNDVGSNTVTLTVTDESGNTSTCQTIVNVVNTTGVEETELAHSFSIYPNPNNGSFRIDLTGAELENNARLTLLDNTGREMMNQPVSSSVIKVEMNEMASGIYILRLDNNGVQVSKRISVNR